MEEIVEISEGLEVEVEDNSVKVKGEKGELVREFPPQVKIEKKDAKIVISSDVEKKRHTALIGTIRAHIRNMMHGVRNGYNYKMKIFYSHFPMHIKVSGNHLMIDNFLGEKHPRKARILEGVEVDIKGQDVSLSGIDIEKVSQTAANIEQATKIKGKDPRVFQDGIYITYKDKVK